MPFFTEQRLLKPNSIIDTRKQGNKCLWYEWHEANKTLQIGEALLESLYEIDQ